MRRFALCALLGLCMTSAIAEEAPPATDLPLEDMRSVEPRLTANVFSVLTVDSSVASRMSYGGTAPEQVRAQIARWKERLK